MKTSELAATRRRLGAEVLLGAKVALGVSALLLSACGANEDRRAPGQGPPPGNNGSGDETQEVTVFVESGARDCQSEGEGQVLCLLVRESEEEEFGLLPASAIEGFDYQWGFFYELQIRVFPEPDPPSDGARERYELVDVVSREEEQLGTTYELSRVVWYETDVTFRRSGDDYLFLGQEFSCASGTDCEGLYGLNNPGAEVNVTFRYLGHDDGGAPMELIEWD